MFMPPWLDPFFNMAGKLLIKMVKENRQESAKLEDKWENWTPEAIAFKFKSLLYLVTMEIITKPSN